MYVTIQRVGGRYLAVVLKAQNFIADVPTRLMPSGSDYKRNFTSTVSRIELFCRP
jgi:hypothetical protein